ncbi:MAG: NADH-quinone oxidoreductase subunit H, partial [Verrucomicrobia bacterium]|nr:NADH-quinone oxidoreductase subunit H [Verrucomicrobiota bacterium]
YGWLISPIWLKGFSPDAILHSFDPWKLLLWIPLFSAFIVFTVSMFAETNRLPFDLPESETELVGGYHTEYSSMKFALFFLGEYAAMITGSAVIVTLFFGAWYIPGIPVSVADPYSAWGVILGLVHITCFFAKVALLLFFFIWVRWTVPRFRFDQLMHLGWYYFFEIALANILLMAIFLAVMPK